MQWVVATASFFASAVEFVEAFTIVLVVGVTVNWRSSLLGALAAAATLALLVLTLGTALVQWVPLDVLRLLCFTSTSYAHFRFALEKLGGYVHNTMHSLLRKA